MPIWGLRMTDFRPDRTRRWRKAHSPTPVRSAFGLLGALMFSLLTGVAQAEDASDFWEFASARCLEPLENIVEPDVSGLKMSAKPLALVPGLNNATLVFESENGTYFFARRLGDRFDTCSAGVVDPVLKRDPGVLAASVAALMALVERGENGYTLTDDVELENRRVLQLESREWREPRIAITYFSDTKLGRLHIFVTEIDKEA